jgi:iron complex transport system substrate-binding protein
MRIVSLLPAATEIVAALGLVDSLVGVSHECDYPAEVNSKPRVTHCEIHGKGLSSTDVDEWVSRTLSQSATLYALDEDLLCELQPDIIVTQQLCDVCAVDYASVLTVARSMPSRPRVVNLSPASLSDIFDDIRRVADATHTREQCVALLASLERRVDAVKRRVAQISSRPSCFIMEWIDPPFCAGHWNPELVELAGGTPALGRAKSPSTKVTWDEIEAAQPEVVILACCGFDIARTMVDMKMLQKNPVWQALPAVRNRRVYAVNGSAYFSRPGPRIVDSLEIVAELLHPDLFHGSFPEREMIALPQAQLA